MFFEFLSLKIQGRKHVDIKRLQEFAQLRRKLNTFNGIHCDAWDRWFCLKFEITYPKRSNWYYFCKRIKCIEKSARTRVVTATLLAIDKSNFTFLCCINNMVYKDIRRLLFEYVCNVQAKHFDCNIKEMDKFIKRNCSTDKEKLWVIEKNGNYKSFTLL